MARYETPSRGRGIDEGLAALLHDPLWLLGRQWQFGEFQHENAASPAWVEVDVQAHAIDEWRPADEKSWQPYDASQAPLERLVEEHGGGPTPRLRLEGGLRLRRTLTALQRADDLAAFAGRCGFAAGPLTDATDKTLRSELPDGALLAACLQRLAGDGRGAELEALQACAPVSSSPEQLTTLAQDWLTWWNDRLPRVIPAAEDSWDENRFEHRFALRASGLPGLELQASEYVGGRLDWSAVDAIATGQAGQPGQPLVVDQVAVPAPARFGGMPAPRFWEMEDARFDPGSIDAAPIDLGRMMLVAYATVYGNDWFVVPVRLPVGTLSQVTRFVVRDVFGRPTELTAMAADQDGWNLFGLTQVDQPLAPDQERPTSPWFLLAPSLPASLESQPTDVVMLFRDEMANVAWAVEAIIADDQGRRLDRFAQWAGRDAPPPVETAVPVYQVVSEVPDHWFPLLPEQLEDLESVRLRLVPFTRLVDGEPVNVEPAGTLLPAVGSWVHEEEVPRSGAQVLRTWQYARWQGGSRHLWQARRKLTGGGEGDSGLRFDRVEETKGA
jgi:hypothetical protein